MLCFFFFFKQKTAYGVPIRDWDSNVCSSDLRTTRVHQLLHLERPHLALAEGLALGIEQAAVRPAEDIRRQRLPQPVLLQQRAQAAQGALARRRRGQAAERRPQRVLDAGIGLDPLVCKQALQPTGGPTSGGRPPLPPHPPTPPTA